MKRIYILGVNGNARDVLEAIAQIRTSNSSFPPVGGFLDDRLPKGEIIDGVPVCGKIDEAAALSDACFVNAIGSPESYVRKKSIIARSGIPDSAFIQVIHPSATVSSTARLGRGCVILSNTSMGSGVNLGNHGMVLQNCVISHDSTLEDGVILATGVCLSGNVRIRPYAYLGSHVSVKGGVEIGEGALIGMGSVVLQNVPPREVWCGNPARFLRRVSSK